MDADRWQRISRLYHEALERPVDQRDAFLDVCCPGDSVLRAEVASLLAHEASAESFLVNAAAEVVDARLTHNAEQRPVGLEPGVRLGTYEIQRALGRGGMGVVFLAHDTTLHRQVALKVLEAPADDETARTRLLREARNAAALNHPNICTVYEVGDADGRPFIAMEYVDGQPLSDRLSEAALPLEEAVRYGTEVADALAYAHDHGVIHRDLKAANAIVTTTGRLKLVDFGLARREDPLLAAATTLPSLVPAGLAAGTPYSMAPEQVRGGATDARTDIWALGVLLYEMVSGTKPFVAATVPELFSSILRDAPAPLRGHVSSELAAVIEGCLHRDVSERYQRGSEVRAALDAIQTGSAPTEAVRRSRLARHRLAVLPLHNLSGDPEHEYFVEGTHDALITDLGGIHALRVIARSSVMRYKGSNAPLSEIAAQLNVDTLLTGSVMRLGDRVRITAQLIDAATEEHLWASRYERQLVDVLSLQNEIVAAIARAISVQLSPTEQARLARVRSVNPEAYEAYLRGWNHVEKLTAADLDAAMHYFELALQKDSSYALGYVGISMVWSARQQMGFAAPSEATPRLKAATFRALELDDTLAEAHFALAAQLAWADWSWAAAEPEFRRAIDLNPNYGQARAFYSHYLHFMKRSDEAMTQIQRAMELDPLNPLTQSLYGVSLVLARRYDEAIVQCRNALRTAPDSRVALDGLSYALHQTRRYDEDLDQERMRGMRRGDPELVEAIALGYAEGGYQGAMRRGSDVLATKSARNMSYEEIAHFHLRAGENDRALDWLERGCEARDPNLPYISSNPNYDSLRSHPRFKDLLRRMGFPS